MDHSEQQHLVNAPFYAEQAGEVALFEHAFRQRLPVLIKGPTGCGKTRFVEHMAARLGRPLITVSCHDDLSAADLVGRHLIGEQGTVWADGPLARAVRSGASGQTASGFMPRRQNSIRPMPSMPYTPNSAVWPCSGVRFRPCM